MPTYPWSKTAAKAGDQAEKRAEEFLRQKGLQPLCRNYRCKLGELDLVMRDGHTLVFVEVRYRANDRLGSAAESVNRRKQSKLVRAANAYLINRPEFHNMPCRFDVIAIADNSLTSIQWFRNAFDAA